MAHWWRTLAAAAVCPLPGVALILGGGFGVVLGLVVVATACLAVGWAWLVDIPARWTAIILLLAAGAANVVALSLAPAYGPWPVAVILGVSIPVAFIREIVRGGPREWLVESVSATATGLVALAGVSLWMSVARADSGGFSAMAVGALGAVGVVVARPWNRDDAGPVWADLARLTLPVAVAAPVAWIATLPFG
jgi:hypothetical protein